MKALESMQASLEAETRGKTEAIKAKKKLEANINEMEMSVDVANRSRADQEKTIKRFQTQLYELEREVCEEFNVQTFFYKFIFWFDPQFQDVFRSKIFEICD